MSILARVCWPLAMLAALGCSGGGDDLPRVAVSGTVNLDNKPVKQGRINFYPENPAGPGVMSGEGIIDGKYTMPRPIGLTPGKYKVSISVDGGAPANLVDGMPGGAGTPNIEAIPARYNTESTLTAEVQGTEPATFNFDLSSK